MSKTKSKSHKIKQKMMEEEKSDAICPSCGVEVKGHRCRLCGAVKTINSVSGNLIWMKNGRIVKAFRDEKQAYIKMAEKWGISKDKWPKKFLGGDI